MEAITLSLVVHQKVVEGGGRVAPVVAAHAAAVAPAAGAGEAERGLQTRVEGVAVQRGAGHERGALGPGEIEAGRQLDLEEKGAVLNVLDITNIKS